MIKIGRYEMGQAVICQMELAGQTFDIEIVPCEDAEMNKLFEPFKRQKSVLNPATKKMEMLSFFDDNDEKYIEATNDLLDRLVKNFHGIGDRSGKILDGTLRGNKILLGSVRVEDFEEIPIEDTETKDKAVLKQKRVRPFRMLIFEKARELAAVVAEAEEKNSASSPASTAQAGR